MFITHYTIRGGVIHYCSTIYIDPFLGIACGAGLAWVYCYGAKSRYDILYLFLLSSLLTLSKDIGLYCSLVLACAACISNCSDGGWRKGESWIGILVIACGTVLPKLLWHMHLSIRDVRKAFSAPIDLKTLWQIIRGQNTTWRQSVFREYFIKLITEPTETTIGARTYPVILLLLALLLCILYYLGRTRQQRSENKGQQRILCLAIAQAALYAVGMVLLYLFKFDEYEGTRFASYNRYLRIPILSVMMMAILIALCQVIRANERKVLAALSLGAALCCVMPTADLRDYLNRHSVRQAVEFRDDYESEAVKMEEVCKQGDNIYFISQRSNGFDYYLMRFRMKPYQLNRGSWSISPTGALYESDVWTRTVSVEQWSKTLMASYQYVCLHEVDETFIENYGDLFAEIPDSGEIYEVVTLPETAGTEHPIMLLRVPSYGISHQT